MPSKKANANEQDQTITHERLLIAHMVLGNLVKRELPTDPGYTIGWNARKVQAEVRQILAEHTKIAETHGLKDKKGNALFHPNGLQQLDAEGEKKWAEVLAIEIPWRPGLEYRTVYREDLRTTFPPSFFMDLDWMFAEREKAEA